MNVGIAVKALLELLVPVARIVDRAQGRKYLEQVLEIKKIIREEESKEFDGQRVNHARIDSGLIMLRDIIPILGPELERSDPAANQERPKL